MYNNQQFQLNDQHFYNVLANDDFSDDELQMSDESIKLSTFLNSENKPKNWSERFSMWKLTQDDQNGSPMETILPRRLSTNFDQNCELMLPHARFKNSSILHYGVLVPKSTWCQRLLDAIKTIWPKSSSQIDIATAAYLHKYYGHPYGFDQEKALPQLCRQAPTNVRSAFNKVLFKAKLLLRTSLPRRLTYTNRNPYPRRNCQHCQYSAKATKLHGTVWPDIYLR